MDFQRDLQLRPDGVSVRVVVESPAGSRVKYRYDGGLESFEWSRLLPLGVRFPYDFGFLPRTLSGDGDPVDAIVVASEATHPGVIVPARVVGATRLEQRRDGGPVKRNDRIIAVPQFDHASRGIADICDIPDRVRAELEAFFQASLALTGKTITLRGWADAREAEKLVWAAEERFSQDLPTVTHLPDRALTERD